MKLNLGAGDRPPIPSFKTVDLFGKPNYKRDVRDLSIFKDNSIELIYASHVLGYFDREEVEDVLKEWYRVLEPGGTLRVAVPDFPKLVTVYYKAGLKAILGPLYGKMNGMYHKTVYDEQSLTEVLSKQFKNVRRYDWRGTIHRYHDDHSQAYFPHMNKQGILISLNMEATK